MKTIITIKTIRQEGDEKQPKSGGQRQERG